MYKIYVNAIPLFLAPTSSRSEWSSTKTKLVANYLGNRQSLLNYIDLLEKNDRYESVVLLAKDVELLKNDFFSLFKIKEAAGGLVQNPDQEILMIYRLEHWDLPKGKIEAGESPELAAVREVQEETGLKEVQLHEALTTTYHTFKSRKGNRILKPTYWFRMESQKEDLIPQAEEGIEEASWMLLQDVLDSKRPTWANIKELLLSSKS